MSLTASEDRKASYTTAEKAHGTTDQSHAGHSHDPGRDDEMRLYRRGGLNQEQLLRLSGDMQSRG